MKNQTCGIVAVMKDGSKKGFGVGDISKIVLVRNLLEREIPKDIPREWNYSVIPYRATLSNGTHEFLQDYRMVFEASLNEERLIGKDACDGEINVPLYR